MKLLLLFAFAAVAYAGTVPAGFTLTTAPEIGTAEVDEIVSALNLWAATFTLDAGDPVSVLVEEGATAGEFAGLFETTIFQDIIGSSTVNPDYLLARPVALSRQIEATAQGTNAEEDIIIRVEPGATFNVAGSNPGSPDFRSAILVSLVQGFGFASSVIEFAIGPPAVEVASVFDEFIFIGGTELINAPDSATLLMTANNNPNGATFNNAGFPLDFAPPAGGDDDYQLFAAGSQSGQDVLVEQGGIQSGTVFNNIGPNTLAVLAQLGLVGSGGAPSPSSSPAPPSASPSPGASPSPTSSPGMVGGGMGDPHFDGFCNQKFDFVTKREGQSFNLFSTADLQVNAMPFKFKNVQHYMGTLSVVTDDGVLIFEAGHAPRHMDGREYQNGDLADITVTRHQPHMGSEMYRGKAVFDKYVVQHKRDNSADVEMTIDYVLLHSHKKQNMFFVNFNVNTIRHHVGGVLGRSAHCDAHVHNLHQTQFLSALDTRDSDNLVAVAERINRRRHVSLTAALSH